MKISKFKLNIIIVCVIVFAFMLFSSTTVYGRRKRTLGQIDVSVNDELRDLGYSEDEISSFLYKINEIFPRLRELENLSDEEKISGLKEMILKNIEFGENDYELQNVLINKKANCLGFSQLFYILGKKIGLDMEMIEVVPYDKERDSKEAFLRQFRGVLSDDEVDNIKGIVNADSMIEGAWHAANLVKVNGKYRILDLTPEFAYESISFGLNEKYQEKGVVLVIKDENRDDINNFYHNIRPIEGREVHAIRRIYDAEEEQDYKKAIELDPNNIRAYIALGQLALGSGEYKEVIKYLDKSIQLYPDYPFAYYHRGIAHYFLHKYEEALADFNRAEELYFGIAGFFPEYYYNRGSIECRLGNYKEAIKYFDHVKMEQISDKMRFDLYYARGLSKYRLGKYEEAAEDYVEAIKIDPEGYNSSYIIPKDIRFRVLKKLPPRLLLKSILSFLPF